MSLPPALPPSKGMWKTMAGSQIVVSSNFGSVTTPPSKTGLMLLLMSLRYIRCMSIDSRSGRIEPVVASPSTG